MASRALVIVGCIIVGGCQASFPEPRALTRGFETEAGVLAPYDDGKLHLAAGRYGLAIDRFGQALASDRGSLDALNGLAIAYTRLGRFDVACAYFDRALEIDGFSALTLNNYGRALIEQGRLRDAGPFLQLALQHASRPELTIIAANVESARRTRPPALVSALAAAPPTSVIDSPRVIRLAANRYRLETSRLPAQPQPAVLAHHPPALRAVIQQRAAPLGAPPERGVAETQAGVPAGVAGDGGSGIARSSATDLAALVPQQRAAGPQTSGSRGATLSQSRAGSRVAAPALARGEPT